jgi:hypothetical protein
MNFTVSISKCYPSIFLKGMRKTLKNLTKVSQSLGRELNPYMGEKKRKGKKKEKEF